MDRTNRPAPVEITYENMRFLMTHNPTNATLNKFIEELKKSGVTTTVRVREATYDTTLVEKEGIHLAELQPLCLGYDQPTWTLSKGFLLFSI
uniref:Uncharacterized protein n=1 Tax=Monodon monoceros TaxID=40151 RepID=A0A8C6B7W7_MONMO